MAAIRKRLREIKKKLSDLTGTCIEVLQEIIEDQRDHHPRMSTISRIKRVDVRAAARRDQKLSYDKKAGYLGTKTKGDPILEVSPYDRVLVIKKDGSYSVINVPEKLFIDKGMLHCGFIDKDLVYNVIYRDKKSQFGYIKRFKVEKFILDKVYDYVPEGAVILDFKIGESYNIKAKYKPKERSKVTEQDFALSDFPIRGLKAGGLKLSSREIKTGSFGKKLSLG
jgi:topoisomerase-4 subunit A